MSIFLWAYGNWRRDAEYQQIVVYTADHFIGEDSAWHYNDISL